MSNFEKVGTFMKTFGQEVKNKAKFPDEKNYVADQHIIFADPKIKFLTTQRW